LRKGSRQSLDEHGANNAVNAGFARGAYVALTKPDVSLLVLMTTGAGFYMGSRGPVDWLRLAHTVFGTMLIAAGPRR